MYYIKTKILVKKIAVLQNYSCIKIESAEVRFLNNLTDSMASRMML